MNIAGKTVPLVPRHKVNVRIAWDFTPETRLAAVWSYVSDQFMDNDEPNTLGTKIPSYTLIDLKLTHRVGNWLLAATLNNALNEKVDYSFVMWNLYRTNGTLINGDPSPWGNITNAMMTFGLRGPADVGIEPSIEARFWAQDQSKSSFLGTFGMRFYVPSVRPQPPSTPCSGDSRRRLRRQGAVSDGSQSPPDGPNPHGRQSSRR